MPIINAHIIKKGWPLVIALLLYYVYFNSVKKVMIPLSGITIPLIVFIVMIYTLKQNNTIYTLSSSIRAKFMYAWVAIGIYIFINNYDIVYTLIKSGMIQTYAMIMLLIFSKDRKEWIPTWIFFTKGFALIYAISTIIFYFMPNLYLAFVNSMIDEEKRYEVMYYYGKGWICGLCDHFSTNGMIISTGLILFFEDIKFHIQSRKLNLFQKSWRFLFTFIVLYGLILTSKRSPMVAVLVAVSFVYIIASGNNIVRKMVMYGITIVVLYVLYTVAVDMIPGMSNLIDKTKDLEDSDAGVLNGRMGLWDLALKMFEDNPLFGNGFGSYYFEAKKIGAITTSAHNYYLQVLAELGVLGIILYLLAFLGSLFYSVKVLRRMEKKTYYVEDSDIISTRIAVEIQVYVLMYNLTATGMMYYQVLIPYFLACTVPCIMHMRYRKLNIIA